MRRRELVLLAAAAGAGAAVGGVLLAARSAAARVEASPDPVPLERLRQAPNGAERIVHRPDGTALRVLVAGEGPTVVFAHGIALTASEWNVVWDTLIERGYRVVAFDQRGHGRSTIGSDGIASRVMAGDYLAVLRAVDAHDAVLVGHSMGGFLGLTAVLEVPAVAARLRGLVLVSAFAGDVYDGAPLNRALVPLLRSGYLLRAAARSSTVGTLFGATFLGDVPSPAMVRALLDMVLPQNHLPLRPILDAFSAEDRYDRLGQIHLPTVVVCGRSDRITPPRASQRLAVGIPGARMIWLEGKGHMLNWESPEALVGAVTSLAGVPSAPDRTRERAAVGA